MTGALELELSDGTFLPWSRPTGQLSRRDKRTADFLETLVEDGEVSRVTAEQAKALLDSVRKRADGWRTGVAATLGLSFATVAIKGPGEGIAKFSGHQTLGLAVAVGVALATGLVSLYFLLRAANGPTWLDMRGPLLQADAHRYLRRARGAAYDLKWGQLLWAVSLAVFIGTTAVSWFLG
jgi:hypothetical protein